MTTKLLLSATSANQTAYWLCIVCIFIIAVLVVALIRLYRKERRIIIDMENAKRSEEVKASFLSHISHALHTPLNKIMINCDTLSVEKGTLSHERQDELIEEINLSSHNLYEYINELLELSNIEGNVPKFNAIEVNLIELIMSYRREILREVNKNVLVRIRTEMSPHTRAVMDTTMVRQLIMHLLQCSAKHTQEGYIIIRYAWEHDGLRFLIEDTGTALPEEICNSLSSKMIAPESNHNMVDKTTILSLSICRAIIDAIHGTIEAKPKEDGGTAFTFWFPCEVKNR